MKTLLRKKHLWHGLLFVSVGVFLLGSYFTIGEMLQVESVGMGPLVAILLALFGAFLLWRGEKLLDRNSIVIEYYDAIVMAVGIALIVRAFVIEPFKIPSGSMIPTLLVGDYLFVNKFSYGYRIPFTKVRVFGEKGPQRGDVAVFKFPEDPGKDYIKRIVGLPGDEISYRNKRLFIHKVPVDYESAGPFIYNDRYGQDVKTEQWIEVIDDQKHSVLTTSFQYRDNSERWNRKRWRVPPGHYFVLGDNRDNSNDSRFWGFVPAYRLVGRAFGIFFSWDNDESTVRWDRLGTAIQ